MPLRRRRDAERRRAGPVATAADISRDLDPLQGPHTIVTAFRCPLQQGHARGRGGPHHLVPWMPIEAMGHRLIEEGCSAYPGYRPDYQWSDADQASYPKWQQGGVLGQGCGRHTGQEQRGQATCVCGSDRVISLRTPRRLGGRSLIRRGVQALLRGRGGFGRRGPGDPRGPVPTPKLFGPAGRPIW